MIKFYENENRNLISLWSFGLKIQVSPLAASCAALWILLETVAASGKACQETVIKDNQSEEGMWLEWQHTYLPPYNRKPRAANNDTAAIHIHRRWDTYYRKRIWSIILCAIINYTSSNTCKEHLWNDYHNLNRLPPHYQPKRNLELMHSHSLRHLGQWVNLKNKPWFHFTWITYTTALTVKKLGLSPSVDTARACWDEVNINNNAPGTKFETYTPNQVFTW